jgi:protein-S-isoprenylcysteine O-methyltransferase Ste14
MNPVVRRYAQIGGYIVVQALALFLPAGRWNWGAGWVYLGLYLAFLAVNAVLILPKGTALIEERGQAQARFGWDRAVSALITLFGPGILIVAGFDERWGWSPALGFGLQAAALVFMALGYGLFAWAMSTNQFFSAVVRIQTERGHTVVTGGPYRFVRHPGYVGGLLAALATPFLLGSLWALVPTVLYMGVVVFRTVHEDALLHSDLAGYREYAQRVKHRLLPGIW